MLQRFANRQVLRLVWSDRWYYTLPCSQVLLWQNPCTDSIHQ